MCSTTVCPNSSKDIQAIIFIFKEYAVLKIDSIHDELVSQGNIMVLISHESAPYGRLQSYPISGKKSAQTRPQKITITNTILTYFIFPSFILFNLDNLNYFLVILITCLNKINPAGYSLSSLVFTIPN